MECNGMRPRGATAEACRRGSPAARGAARRRVGRRWGVAVVRGALRRRPTRGTRARLSPLCSWRRSPREGEERENTGEKRERMPRREKSTQTNREKGAQTTREKSAQTSREKGAQTRREKSKEKGDGHPPKSSMPKEAKSTSRSIQQTARKRNEAHTDKIILTRARGKEHAERHDSRQKAEGRRDAARGVA